MSLAYVSRQTRLKSGVGQKPRCVPPTMMQSNVKPTAETTTATIPFFKFAEEEEEEEEEEEVPRPRLRVTKVPFLGISLMEGI